MFLRSKKVRGRLYWSVVRNRRVGGRVRQETIETLGPHPDRESAQRAWDKLRGPFFGPDGMCDAAADFWFASIRKSATLRHLPGCFAVLGLDRIASEQEQGRVPGLDCGRPSRPGRAS